MDATGDTPEVQRLLQTKFHVPAARGGRIPRAALLDRLDRGAVARLTLVSAPAGFGKTTLLAEWLAALAAHGAAVGWLSLDAADNQPASFWTYVVTALQAAADADYSRTLALLQSSDTPLETPLGQLLNDLEASPREVLLVLDDYHVIDTREIHEGVLYLLERMPAHVHLALSSRADPPFPLARLRAQGELVEVRAADLRFTAEEAANYLNAVMQLNLDPQQVAALEQRTEGWAVALQLAALSMQGRSDPREFINRFAGDDRYIVDYLVEEVLRRQPNTVREFLLHTSILDRLNASLCDALTESASGRAMLETLERANLFVVPLDDRRQWYRYHHLFADMLRARLQDEQPDAVSALHTRASAWYEHNDQPAEAIRHGLAASDYTRAATLIELALPSLRANREEALRRSWLEALPDAVLRDRPALSNEYAGALLQRGELEGVEQRLRDAEAALLTLGTPEGSTVVMDSQTARRLPSGIAIHRAGQALMLGRVPEAMAHAQRALDSAEEDDDLVRGGASGLLALGHWANGDLDSAAGHYADAITKLDQAGHHADATGCRLALFDLYKERGRLTDALAIAEDGLRRATPAAGPPLRGAADMLIATAEVLLERNEVPASHAQLQRAEALGSGNGLPQSRYRVLALESRLHQATGDIEAALDALEEAEREYTGDFSPNARPLSARQAKLMLTAGQLSAATTWARTSGLTTEDNLAYVHEFAHITLARVLLATASSRTQAFALLDRLLLAAESGGRIEHMIELLTVRALGHHASGDRDAALDVLDRALQLAAPEGYCRSLIEEGAPLIRLLKEAVRQHRGGGYAQQLLAAAASSTAPAFSHQGLREPLSERELEVLRLLGTDLDGPDIARELVISLNTLRTHTKRIYAKLGVGSRRGAVRRALEFQLLSGVQ